MTACNQHANNPVKGYSPCPGCEIERLRAELAGLRTGFDAQNQVIAGLKKNAERYQWLRMNVGVFRTGGGIGPVSCYLLSRPPATDSVSTETDLSIDAAMGKGGNDGA